MKGWAVVAHNEPLQCVDLADPEITGTSVLLEVTRCGVCRSDMHLWHGKYDLGGGRYLTVKERGIVLPAAPGHEIVGKVVALGPDATGLAIGDTRLVYPWVGCGHCPRCEAGDDNLCTAQRSLGVSVDGGFADRVRIPHPRYAIPFDGLDPSLAATYACSGLTAFSAVKKIRPADADAPVVLIGAGGLGLAAIAVLRAFGHRAIVAVDVSEANRAAALAAGASAVVDGEGSDVAERTRAAAKTPVEAVIDFVGRSATATAALDMLTKGGTLVLVGIGGGEITLSVAGTVFRSQTILGSLTGSLGELRELIAFAAAGRLAPTPIEEQPRANVNEVMQRLEAGRVTGRVVLVH